MTFDFKHDFEFEWIELNFYEISHGIGKPIVDRLDSNTICANSESFYVNEVILSLFVQHHQTCQDKTTFKRRSI